MTRTAHALEISGDRVWIVTARKSFGRVREEIVLDGRRPDSAEAAAALLNVRHDAESGRAALAAAYPACEALFRRLVAPIDSVTKAKRVLPSMLDIQLPFPVEKGICGFTAVRPAGAGETAALAVAARREDVERFLQKTDALAGPVSHLDHESIAIWSKSIADTPLALTELRAVLYIGGNQSALAIGRGRDLLAAQGFRTGTSKLESDTGSIREWATRIQQAVRPVRSSAPEAPFQWALCGPGAEDASLVDRIKDTLVPAPDDRWFVHRQPAAFLAAALATRALSDADDVLNLRTEELAPASVATRRERAGQLATLSLLFASIVLLAGNVAWRTWVTGRIDAMQRDVSRTALALTGMTRVPKGQELLTVERVLAERASREAPMRRQTEPAPVGFLRDCLGEAARLKLDLAAFVLRDETLTIRGTGPEWNSAEPMREFLKKNGWSVELQQGDATLDERIPFVWEGRS